MARPAGEAESDALRLDFDRRLELEFHSSSVTSDAGLLVDRELDDARGLMAITGQYLVDGPRPGNVHSADGWRDVLEPVAARYRERDVRRYFRADAAFANPEVYAFLEAEGYAYTIRPPANRMLQERIGHPLKRPVGRPSLPRNVAEC